MHVSPSPQLGHALHSPLTQYDSAEHSESCVQGVDDGFGQLVASATSVSAAAFVREPDRIRHLADKDGNPDERR